MFVISGTAYLTDFDHMWQIILNI